MMVRIWLVTLLVLIRTVVSAQGGVQFSSGDTLLQRAFDNVKAMALSYRGNPKDGVGPWYEAALPSRNAFCMRDVSHQCIAAELLGMSRENSNMFSRFLQGISEEKDWCSFWEINNQGVPAPEDYRNDKAFWYNLNANFDVIYACWRLYLWTGDSSYISGPVFNNFLQRSLHDYVDRWKLQPGDLHSRPAYLNAPVPFDSTDNFHTCRGLGSYTENVPGLNMGVDLVAALSRGFQTGADITGDTRYGALATAYREEIDKNWWDKNSQSYNTYLTRQGAYGKGEGEVFLLWFDALTDSARLRATVEQLVGKEWNVETTSYLPAWLYQNGYEKKAYEYLLQLSDPATKRREYPEVSYGVVDAFVRGLMGVDADSRYGRISTVYRGQDGVPSTIGEVPVLGGKLTLQQDGKSSTLLMKGGRAMHWRAGFAGRHDYIRVGKKRIKATQQQGKLGNIISYIDVTLRPGKGITASLTD
ncbi:hypothetical protein [Flavihumibacter petaseus]|uniref:Alpha-L-rhamnosidase six-hairpin glycosidase domain-containing protein n=1 Tax=Flavihumibacter petaseus NBRC 106054 TaxID=1220578 RepID=A0A0E9MXT6_9BACT|nr:hypothetical protein [Flavihumibacter petaseus]GAO41935.1 hypothetical protein FPE01S_01_09500 [Flavihumibacter petaseus NBRC 106054]